MKIALVSTGLGRVLRGFESFEESLFQVLTSQAPHTEVTLFQGGGRSGERRLIVPNFHRNDIFARCFGQEKGNLLEKRSFALALYPFLRLGRYDIVHYNELVMGSALYHLRRYFGGRFKLLYCNGAPSPPIHYHHRCDFAQVLTGPAYEEARKFGIIDKRLLLIPYGVDAQLFSMETRKQRDNIRRRLEIPEDAKIVLTVGALKREHKRIDYIIREVGKLAGSVWLLAAGQRTEDTLFLEKEADRILPGRWRFVSWPHRCINLLYGAADVFVLASLTEAFGLVIIEAMLSGLPVIVHDAPVFKWIANGTEARCIRMSCDGELERTLNEVLLSRNGRSSRAEAMRRFSWESLATQYMDMYHRVMTS